MDPAPACSRPEPSPGPADWRAKTARCIETHRKGDFTLRLLTGPDGRPLPDTAVRVRLVRHGFLFGAAVNTDLLTADTADGARYREFLVRHFSGLVDENSMKWYRVEKQRGVLDFTGGDALAAFAREHGMALRGHCLLWAKTKYLPAWARNLPGPELKQMALAQVRRMAERYRGQLVAWDVNNEMLDGHHFEQTISPGINAEFFLAAHEADPKTPLFVNDYRILDSNTRTEQLLSQIRALQEAGAPIGGIGIQEHAAERFAPARSHAASEQEDRVERQSCVALDPAEVIRRLDRIAATGLPIHLTEVSAKTPDEHQKADALETLYRIAFAHPGVEAILLWGFWSKSHWMGAEAALVDDNWNLLPAGRRIFEELLGREWTTDLELRTDPHGMTRFRGFYGTYRITARSGAAAHRGVKLIRNGPREVVVALP